jgi:hypothetical protein
LLLGLVLGLALLHILGTWGSVAVWWGDTGRWLHEVDRYARGATPYRDFFWPFPPLALWLMGTAGRVFGTSTVVMFSLSSLVFGAVAVALAYYVRAVLPNAVVPQSFVGVTTLFLAIPFSALGGSPLATGTYTPAQPIGFLLLILALTVALPVIEVPATGRALVAMVLAAGAVLTKQDFWIPAALLVGATMAALGVLHRRWGAAFAAGCVFGLTVALGLAAVALSAGGRAVVSMLTGGGHIAEFRGRGLPSWERLTLEGFTLSGLTIGGLIALWLGGAERLRRLKIWFIASVGLLVASGSLHVAMTLRVLGSPTGRVPSRIAEEMANLTGGGANVLRAAVRVLHDDTLRHALPVLLPVFVLVLVLWNRRSLKQGEALVLIGLLAMALGARARRLFESVEWFHVMLELPIYVLAVQLFWDAEASRSAPKMPKPVRRAGSVRGSHFVGLVAARSPGTQAG